jgi:hypothetical protein
MRDTQWRSAASGVLVVCGSLLCGLPLGCQKSAPSVPTREPVIPTNTGAGTNTGGGGTGTDTGTGGTTPVLPVAPAGPLSMAQVLATLPKDKMPKPGADGADSRDATNEWLEQNVVGKSVEEAFRIDDIESRGDGPDRYSITPLVNTDFGARRPSGGALPIGETRVGSYQCLLQIAGPDPTWRGVPADQKFKYENLKGKKVKVRGKAEAVHFLDGGNDQLVFTVQMEAMEVVRDDPKPNPSAETLVTAATQAVKAAPQPKSASEWPEPAAAANVTDELLPAGDFFPYRRVITPMVDGKPHGELRAYGPKRRLIAIDPHKNGQPHGERWSFYPSGKAFSMIPFVDGLADGNSYRWYEDGKLAYFDTWKKGVQDGPTGSYSTSGKPTVLCEMKAGKYEGVRNIYLPSGPLFAQTLWKDGVEVAREVYGEVKQNFLDVDSLANIEKVFQQKPVLKDYWTDSHQNLPGPVEGRRKVNEWHSLFNGKDTAGWWPEMPPDESPERWMKWEVKEGVLIGSTVPPPEPERGKAKRPGRIMHLISDDDFLNFHLKAEVRIDATSNSGICFGAPYVFTSPVLGYEAQIAMADKAMVTGGLGRAGHAMRKELNPLHHKADEWFTMEVIVRDGKVVVKVNGTTTAEEKWAPFHEKRVERGHIGLQVHGGQQSRVEFRKIEIMPLPD